MRAREGSEETEMGCSGGKVKGSGGFRDADAVFWYVRKRYEVE